MQPYLRAFYSLNIIFYALNPIILLVLVKVYCLYWIVLFNITVSYLFLFTHYSFTFIINYYIIKVVNVRLDCLCELISIIIVLISSCVILCSIDYLSIIDCISFICSLFLFEFFMLLFVCSSSFIIIFFSWDWLGLTSYLLINFWSSKTRSGIKAVVYNKIGDIGLIIVLCFCYSLMPFINYSPFLPFILILFVILMFSVNYINLCYLCFFLLLALLTKSAQLPWSSWLIAAMSAPTPTSALLHSSTMVIAGVYLGLIMQPLFILVFLFYWVLVVVFLFLLFISLMWSVFKAIFLSDIKSIIAFSTISQISYMFIGLFNQVSFICFFHIIIHALFKSLLFLVSGSFIHYQSSFQLIYKLKVFHSFLCLIFICGGCVLIISLSKEGIIYSTSFIIASSFCAMLVVLGGIFTMIYTIKIYSLVFCGIFISFCALYAALCSFCFILPLLGISGIFIDQTLEYIFFCLNYYLFDSFLFFSCVLDYSLFVLLVILSLLYLVFYSLTLWSSIQLCADCLVRFIDYISLVDTLLISSFSSVSLAYLNSFITSLLFLFYWLLFWYLDYIYLGSLVLYSLLGWIVLLNPPYLVSLVYFCFFTLYFVLLKSAAYYILYSSPLSLLYYSFEVVYLSYALFFSLWPGFFSFDSSLFGSFSFILLLFVFYSFSCFSCLVHFFEVYTILSLVYCSFINSALLFLISCSFVLFTFLLIYYAL